jgi:hypothetical protein
MMVPATGETAHTDVPAASCVAGKTTLMHSIALAIDPLSPSKEIEPAEMSLDLGETYLTAAECEDDIF